MPQRHVAEAHPAQLLFAWAPDDKLFPLEHAQRLAAAQPDARVETIAGSRAFSMIDQPDVLARLIGELAEARQRSAAGQAMR
ncbi:MAG: hypothetical protein HOQ03_04810 [Thermoleophilia bacterium]|nr:hypothetical protein [Thermoleophilia bacterium]